MKYVLHAVTEIKIQRNIILKTIHQRTINFLLKVNNIFSNSNILKIEYATTPQNTLIYMFSF